MEIEMEEESWEVMRNRSDVLESISKLYALLNINHPLHHYLDPKTRHVLKTLLDAAVQDNLLFRSLSRFPNDVSPPKRLCTLHSHDKPKQSQSQSQSVICKQQLVSDMSKLSVSYYSETIVKRCRLCNSKHAVNSCSLIPSTTQKDTPWFPCSSPYCSNCHPYEAVSLVGQQQCSSQQLLNENVDLRDTIGWTKLIQRPTTTITVNQNTAAWPSEKQYHYIHGLRVPRSVDDAANNSIMSKTKNEMSSQPGDSLLRGPAANLQKDSNLYTSSILLHQRLSKHMVSQRQLKHSKEKSRSSSSSISPSYSPSSYSWTSRQQTSTGFGSNSQSLSSSQRECASPSTTQKQSNSNSSFTSSSDHTRDADGDGGSGRVGRLKRFKNKLGLIFHHHHHHHHHQKVDDDNTKRSTSRHPTRILKHLQKHEEKPELHAEKAVVKHGRTAIDRKQAHHFHELVQGLIHHIRRSKKSKKSETSEAGIRRHGHKKNHGRILQQQGGSKYHKESKSKSESKERSHS